MSTTSTAPPRSPGRSASRRFGLATLVTLLASGLPLPLSAVALPGAVLAAVLGIRALIALSQERARGLLIGWTAVGLALVVVVGVGTAGTYALYPVNKERQDCLAGAGTQQATADCNLQWRRHLERLVPGSTRLIEP